MNKAELIKKMANDAAISKTEASNALDAFINGVSKSLNQKEGKITITGFGSFSKRRRKARIGRNPRSGEEVKIKATNVVKFKPSKKLKDAI